MSGITTGTGIFSGIDTKSLIDQLIALEARPKFLAQSRIVQLRSQQAALLDINSKVSALKSAAGKFRLDKLFDLKRVSSSNDKVLTATSGLTAALGVHTFTVDRLVSTQQLLSRGFADRSTTGLNATDITFESSKARLDRDVSLADFNAGAGVQRGKIIITDSAGRSATVDLSRAIHVSDVLDAINGNGAAQVTASVSDGSLVIKDNAGGTLTVANALGYTTAASLGIAGSATGTLTGASVYGMSANTSLSSLNDGNGIAMKNAISETASSFTISIQGVASPIKVNLGDVWETVDTKLTKTASAATTAGGAVQRINEALAAAGVTDVSASIDAANGRFQITDSTGTRTITVAEGDDSTAKDLGLIDATGTTTLSGRRVLAGLNTILTRSLSGGAGLAGDGVLNFTTRDGFSFSTTIDPNSDLNVVMRQIESAGGTVSGQNRLSLALDANGTGFIVTDNTGGGSNLVITGTSGADTAASLGISTGAAGIAASTKASGNLQKQYISRATQLAGLNNGKGIGTGKFRLTDSQSQSIVIDIGTDSKTLGDIISEINTNTTTTVRARINANGDGLEIYDSAQGAVKIKVEDVSGTVAKSLNIAGTAAGVGAANSVNGTFERTVSLEADDTLDEIVQKINNAGVGVSAAVISDGNGATPFRLTFTSRFSGRDGRFIASSNTLDLALSSLSKGENSLVFFGAGETASAIAVSGSTNTVDGVLPGVKINLHSVSASPVTLSVEEDYESVEAAATEFYDAFTKLVQRINEKSRYNAETEVRGVLQGDGAMIELRSTMLRVLQGRVIGATGRYDQLSDLGLSLSKDGEISIDRDRLREAMATDPESVKQLFTLRTLKDDSTLDLGGGATTTNPNAGQSFSALGVMGQLEQAAERYINSVNGVLTNRNKGYDSQIEIQNRRLTAMDVRLEGRRLILERQFAAMEKTIGRLQIQSSSLGVLSSMVGRR